jgi:hypothetical protein
MKIAAALVAAVLLCAASPAMAQGTYWAPGVAGAPGPTEPLVPGSRIAMVEPSATGPGGWGTRALLSSGAFEAFATAGGYNLPSGAIVGTTDA